MEKIPPPQFIHPISTQVPEPGDSPRIGEEEEEGGRDGQLQPSPAADPIGEAGQQHLPSCAAVALGGHYRGPVLGGDPLETCRRRS